MRVLVTGAAGMLGARLAATLRVDGLGGAGVDAFVLADRVEPAHEPGDQVLVGDIADADFVDLLASTEPDVIFHLAAVVSGAAEADLDAGYDVNVHGVWHLLEAARCNPDWTPRIVVASSVAVFSDAAEAPLPSMHRRAPRSSYGTQKAMGELLLADYTRRGAVDGVAVRLATIVVRTAAPNEAASTFLSTIVRAGLRGDDVVVPVARHLRAWIASPDAAVGQLVHAGGLSGADLGDERCLTMPGLSVSVDDLLAAIGRHGDPDAVAPVIDRPDEAVEAIVASWPSSFDSSTAVALGFRADRDLDEVITNYLRWVEQNDADDVTGMDFGRLADHAQARRSGASEPMTSHDDAAASLLAKVRDFIDTLGDEERQVFAAMMAPAVAEAWEADEVAGFEAWSPTRVQDHLHQAIRNERFVIGRADPEDLA